jgi:dTDP-4-amino-4,6-dideoxygalactose transaminase
MPSYTFVTSANAFVLHGGKPVFVDIRPDTMNIDENLIEAAITDRTRAIMVMHYGGVGCNMDVIMKIADKHDLIVIEDAAQALFSRYKHKPLGTFGDFGCFSFHETKNYTSGEGGAIVVNNKKYVERSEIIREKGTDRSKFFRGEVDKYSWVDIGSSYVMSELNSAYLYGQLEAAHEIDKKRYYIWQRYFNELKPLQDKGFLQLPVIPAECQHNSHIFYVKARSLEERAALIKYLKERNIHSVFHYIPLHSSVAGKKYGRMVEPDKYTTFESERILRLPMFYNMENEEIDRVIKAVSGFYC